MILQQAPEKKKPKPKKAPPTFIPYFDKHGNRALEPPKENKISDYFKKDEKEP